MIRHAENGEMRRAKSGSWGGLPRIGAATSDRVTRYLNKRQKIIDRTAASRIYVRWGCRSTSLGPPDRKCPPVYEGANLFRRLGYLM